MEKITKISYVIQWLVAGSTVSHIPRSLVAPLLEMSFRLPIYRLCTLGHTYPNCSLYSLNGGVQN